MEPLKLSLKRKEQPVELEMEDGSKKSYIIRELTGKERDQYLNQMGDRVKFNSEGKMVGLKTFDGVQSSLLSLCLIGPDGKTVAQDVIQGFPAEAQNTMFEAAQKLSALDKEAEDKEKKSEG